MTTTQKKKVAFKPLLRPARRSWAEPWKVKVVEPLKLTTRPQRERAIAAAGYNTFLLRSEDAVLRRLRQVKTGATGGAQLGDHLLIVRERNLNLDAGFLPELGDDLSGYVVRPGDDLQYLGIVSASLDTRQQRQQQGCRHNAVRALRTSAPIAGALTSQFLAG